MGRLKLATTPGLLLCSASTSPRGCALLEIKNLKSGETHNIPPEGALLGREGAKADIPIRDPGVSKKHARIFEKGGVWYLQDVGSSNGTFMQGKRLTGPTVLSEGSVFGMSRHKFKVTRIGNGPGVGVSPGDDDEALFGDDLAPPPSIAPPMESRSSAPQRPPLPQDDFPPLSPSGPDEVSYGDLGQTAPPGPSTGTPMPSAGGGDEIESKGVGYFFIAVPKAVAYYLAAVPLLALNPFGSVRKSIDEQPHAAMGPMELIAYALPAMVFGAVFSSWCALIGALIGGGGFQFMLLLPIVPVISAVVGSVISGFVLHPVLGWLIRVLKGSSDARSRTNYFLMAMTAYVLTTIPSGLGTLLTLMDVPFLNILAPLLLMVASLLSLLVVYKWLVFFNVMKAIQIIVLVLGALGALGTAVNVVKATIASFERVLGGGGGDAGDAEEAAAKVAELQSKLAAIATDASLTPEEKAAKAAELTAELTAAQEASKAAAEAAAAAALEAQKQAAEDAKAAVDDAKAALDDAKPDEAKSASDDAKPDDKKVEEKVEDKKAPPPVSTARGKLPRAPSDFSYPQFKDRRDKMEDALGKDVTLLSRVKGTLPAYQRYHQKKHEIDQKWAAETAARPDQKVVHERLAEEELYLRTYKDVQAFWRAIESYRP